MPKILDLTGCKFGRLTVVSLRADRKKGRTQWLCRCKCGAEVLVTTRDLRSGHTRSCGRRPVCRKLFGKLFTSKTARAAFKATEIKEDEEGTWYARRKAAKYLKRHPDTLRDWAIRCRWLDNKALQTKQFMDGTGFESTYYLKNYRHKGPDDVCSIDDILVAQARKAAVPEYAGYTHIKIAAADLGITYKTLWETLRKGGKQPKRETGKCFRRTGGHASRAESCPRSYVPNDFLDKIKRARQPNIPTEKLTLEQAAAKLRDATGVDVKDWHILRLAAAGCLTVERGWKIRERRKKNGAVFLWPRRGKFVGTLAIEELSTALAKVCAEQKEAARGSGQVPRLLRLAAELANATSSQAANAANHATDPSPKRRSPGRPTGSHDPAARRRHKLIVDAWQTGQYKTVADLARLHHVDRTTASKILKAAGLTT